MKLRRAAQLATQLLLLTPTGLRAQTSAPPFQLDSGTVVRLQLHSGAREKGKLLSPYAQDSSRVRYCHYPAPPCRVGDERYRDKAASDVSNLEVRRGTAWLPGLVIGGLVGAAFGAFVVGFEESVGDRPVTDGEKFRAIAGGTLIFGGLGALVGSAFERWGRPD
ncbi:MAG TPA: hypothetical protein VK899_02795 [Gemmatimonadales bacterium]|nr:hypothetical protein [Gemmatimonadales bacterium]